MNHQVTHHKEASPLLSGSDGLEAACRDPSKRIRPKPAMSAEVERELFARAFVHLNGDYAAAYLRLYPRARDPWGAGLRLRVRKKVDARIRELQAHSISDGRHRLTVRALACRNCFGNGHRRQRTSHELERDRREHERAEREMSELYAKHGKAYQGRAFDEEGGVGFHPGKAPNPDCPNCYGRGVKRVCSVDTMTGRLRFPRGAPEVS